MPYIDQHSRTLLYIGDEDPETVGQLNFVLTHKCLDYLHIQKESYQTYNDIIGALECAKLEMYRRMVVPYEEAKKEINGDVYPE